MNFRLAVRLVQGQNILRLFEMRDVGHFTADGNRACARIICKCFDDSIGVADLRFGGHETLIDGLDLRRVDGEHARKAFSE